MYAIVQTGGKQYKVQPGEQVKVEKIPGEPGSEIQLNDVLALSEATGLVVGQPMLENTSVKATILRTDRDRKIVVFKKKRRKGYHKKQGHRQWYTLLRIEDFVRSDTGGIEQVSTPSPDQIPEP
ncbi:MAG: large subunit ribosomal protein [Thermodesulfobacteriota bacterium]|jgi:large subunit ribosomal protein L21|nr:large subunit ribosomal protein [Thermodesulfobacteriota bacterium]